MATFDTIIKGGMVVDGTRVPRYHADLGIKNGKIAQIGRLKTSEAAKVIDASGLIVAPGSLISTLTTTPRSTGTPIAPLVVGMG